MRGDEVADRVAAELLVRGDGELPRDGGLGDDRERLDRGDVGALDERLRRLAGREVDRARAASSASAAASSPRGRRSPRRSTCPPRSRRRGSSPGGGRCRSRRAPRSRALSASAKPSPISTPFTAWIPITAAASRASSRSSFAAYDAEPGRHARSRAPRRRPPTVSRVARASSMRARSRSSSTVDACDRDADRCEQRLRDGAGRDVHRRVARRRALERVAHVVVAVLEHAGEVGVAGPRQRHRLRPLARRLAFRAATGYIPHVQFLWSRLRTTSASGVPSVRPCRSPASTSTRSCSICCRGERP